MSSQLAMILAALFGGSGVMLGAFGAHGLRGRVEDRLLETFQTAVQYQLTHALALLLVAVLALNLGRSREDALEIVDNVLCSLDLMHLRDRVTHKLSGGEKRLVTLATVLAMQPEILLLDEPTNALDVKNEARLVEILGGLELPLLLVTHSPEFRQKIAPDSYALEKGQLIRL